MLRQVIDNINISINIFDENGKRIFVNPYYYELAGKKPNSSFRKNFNTKGVPEDRKIFYEKVKEAIADGTFSEINDYRSKTEKGTRYLDILVGPLKDRGGNITGAYSIARDSTSRFLAHQKLNNLNSNLEKKIRERTVKLEKINAKLKKAAEEKNVLMSHVAHEIKTILTIIKGNIDIIKDGISLHNDFTDECENEIDKGVEKMSKIITDLVFITRSENIPNPFKFERLDARSIIREVIKEQEIFYKHRDFRIFFSKSKKPVEIVGDRAKIHSLISNLVENAIKYGKEKKGRLWIKIEEKKSKVDFSFVDNGQGIEESKLEYIFDPFYQVKKTNNPKINRGFGLGLAICKKIVVLHKGEIRAESKLGNGTTFFISLPKQEVNLSVNNAIFNKNLIVKMIK